MYVSLERKKATWESNTSFTWIIISNWHFEMLLLLFVVSLLCWPRDGGAWSGRLMITVPSSSRKEISQQKAPVWEAARETRRKESFQTVKPCLFLSVWVGFVSFVNTLSTDFLSALLCSCLQRNDPTPLKAMIIFQYSRETIKKEMCNCLYKYSNPMW